jgi:hypothetical protein
MICAYLLKVNIKKADGIFLFYKFSTSQGIDRVLAIQHPSPHQIFMACLLRKSLNRFSWLHKNQPGTTVYKP